MDATAWMPPASLSRAQPRGQRALDCLYMTSRLFSSFRDAMRNTFGLGDSQAAPALDRGPSIYLAAFGKHPGWDDHIDDLGLETAQLAWVKRLLYVEGIAGNLDNGQWDALTPAERLEKFNHGFVWKIDQTLTLGRMWSSTDGKGRARYPMVIAVECSGLPTSWVLEHVPPRLESLQQQCTATRSADVVRASVDRARGELRAAASASARKKIGKSASVAGADADPVDVIARCPEIGQDYAGLLSVLYEIEHDMAAFRPDADAQGGRPPSGGGGASLHRAHHLRVPACLAAPFDAMHLWIRFMGMKLDGAAPVLAIQPLEEKWMDIVVGDPSATDVFCIRASRKKITLTTDIPYALSEEFLRRAKNFIAEHCSKPAPNVRSPAPP
jgi:hypothetical protein